MLWEMCPMVSTGSGDSHLRTQSARPLKRSVWPAAYAGESGDRLRGSRRREMMTAAQYAPLCRQES